MLGACLKITLSLQGDKKYSLAIISIRDENCHGGPPERWNSIRQNTLLKLIEYFGLLVRW